MDSARESGSAAASAGLTSQQKLVRLPPERKGRFGEAVCENVMRASGMTYIPLCRIEDGGAPMAVSDEKKTVLPDFDVSGSGVFAYLDAKVKTQSIRYRRTGEVRHGINASNYNAYVQMGVLQNKQCGLFLVELLDDSKQWSGALMAQSFPGLGEPRKGYNEDPPKVYWPRARFCLIGTYSADELVQIAKGERHEDIRGLLQESFAPPPKRCDYHSVPEDGVFMPELYYNGTKRKMVCRRCGVWLGYAPVER